MGISSSRHRRDRQNPNVTYAQQPSPYGPYAPPAMYPRPGQQALPPPMPGAAPTPYDYNHGRYRAHYMNHGQYQQQGYAWPHGAAPPPNPAYPQAPPPQPQQNPSRRAASAVAAAAPAPAPAQQEFTQTATIRNSVNLKKETLRLVPVEGDPTKLQVSFTFDASAACSVTTFIMATEDPACSRIRTASQPAAPALFYDRGLGHRFPKAGDPAGAQHVLDLGKVTDAQMRAATAAHAANNANGTGNGGSGATGGGAQASTFPLVVRLETLTDKGAKEGRSLRDLAPGHEHKAWVQSQTTYAAVARNEDGEYEVRVLEQKIWVEGTSYKLQEIYGMDAAAGAKSAAVGGAAAGAAEDSEERLCIICLVNERDTTVLPCRHMCMCKDCAQELSKQTSKCPICRNTVESLLHIKVQRRSRSGRSRSQRGAAAAQAAAAAGGST